MPNTLPGNIVRHFKGGLYKIIARARDAADPNNILIVYLSLRDGQYWVRREVEFNDEVKWSDGYLRKRFIVDRPDEPHIVSEPGPCKETELSSEWFGG